jgi:hypothetical protein
LVMERWLLVKKRTTDLVRYPSSARMRIKIFPSLFWPIPVLPQP